MQRSKKLHSVIRSTKGVASTGIERGKTKKESKSPKSIFSRPISNHICWQYHLNLPYKHPPLFFLPLFFKTMSQATNRISTRSTNATQHPGLLVPKQVRRPTEVVAAERKAKEEAKTEKQRVKTAGIKRVAEFEQKQAADDAMEQTPKVVTKPKPLVRTRSYADVLRANDVDMVEGQSAEPDSAFEPANVEDGQTTESDGMETAVEQAPPRKKMKVDTKRKKGKAPSLRDAVKAAQGMPAKNQTTEASDGESMKIDVTPKPIKNSRMRAQDPPATPPKQLVVQPTMIVQEEGPEDLPSNTKGKKYKGKKPKTTNNGGDQIHGRKYFHVLSHLSHAFTNIDLAYEMPRPKKKAKRKKLRRLVISSRWRLI